MADPGYLQAVWENELGGRYLGNLEGNEQPFLYYFHMLVDRRYTMWFIFVPLGLFTLSFTKDRNIRRFGVFSTVVVITYYLAISMSRTKLMWYDLPMYPFLAVIVAVPIYSIFQKLREKVEENSNVLIRVASVIFLIMIFMAPYRTVWKSAYSPREEVRGWETYSISTYLKRAVAGRYRIGGYHHLYDGYDAHILFYHRILEKQGVELTINRPEILEVGDHVIVHQDGMRSFMVKHFLFEVENRHNHVEIYRIIARLNNG